MQFRSWTSLPNNYARCYILHVVANYQHQQRRRESVWTVLLVARTRELRFLKAAVVVAHELVCGHAQLRGGGGLLRQQQGSAACGWRLIERTVRVLFFWATSTVISVFFFVFHTFMVIPLDLAVVFHEECIGIFFSS